MGVCECVCVFVCVCVCVRVCVSEYVWVDGGEDGRVCGYEHLR